MSDLLRKRRGVVSRWVGFENHSGRKGAGAKANRGAKGHSCEPLAAGEVKTLLDVQGGRIITRIFLTTLIRTPEMLRSLRLDIYWDGAERPAVPA